MSKATKPSRDSVEFYMNKFVGLQLLNGIKAFGKLVNVTPGNFVILTKENDVVSFPKTIVQRLLIQLS